MTKLHLFLDWKVIKYNKTYKYSLLPNWLKRNHIILKDDKIQQP